MEAWKENGGNEISTLHNEKKKICFQEEQNLNNDYSIIDNDSSKMPNNKSLDLFVGLVVWCKLEIIGNESLLVVVIFDVFGGIPNTHVVLL